MKLSELKPGQKVSLNGILAEYQGIHKVRIPNSGKWRKGFSGLMKREITCIIILMRAQKL
ncbi:MULTISPECIES: hypothetical protein [Weeksellaceae]|jgi:hypothetical protein|uniref:Uncharacterized protein n=1 Tax=Elizabethkingia anophelis TaxID=1117645 RepID=A0A7Z7LYR0_9FLAO|nr:MULTISPECIES: hypothetical protein [Weeksellaceae]KFF76026.1 hypothetical protein HX13_01370 [Chryseobacterium sp. P1-3]MDV3586887.1 hypothetical protein [Elizabethkingia anophelis]MDV3622529.1 hypothetical protein [Elizabethkingia anophelis]MDV3670444.1 hypothetical protein [Elizabethkingia anophelis]MDV3680504.1 hypothetical protein [Elizabethkingia anophelis]